MSAPESGDILNQSLVSDMSATPEPPRKRRREASPENGEPKPSTSLQTFCPANTKIVRILRNDSRGKVICLHAKFADSLDKDAIIVLQKSPFPNDVDGVCKAKLGVPFDQKNETETGNDIPSFSEWQANEIVNNDIFHRIDVKAGLEHANNVSMTVIHPAEAHHFAKYSASRRRIVWETPELYTKAIVPFLESHPKDLSWVDNILKGTHEAERVLFKDEDEDLGFVHVLDYRWDGRQLHELHSLALARHPSLTCLRDLRGHHVPMLKKMLEQGRRSLVEKYGGEGENPLTEDKLIAYFHYPPTFYRLHMHFIHVDGAADGGTQAGKAHLAEDVIANLEMKSNYYADRTLAMYLHDNHPFCGAIRKAETAGEQPSSSE